jgi:hypothetical protein
MVLDTISSRITFSLTISREVDSTTFSGTITSIATQTGNRIGRSPQDPRQPLAFTGRLSGGISTITPLFAESTDPQNVCDDTALPALPAVGRALVLSPIELRQGARWIDSSYVSACAGPIPITITTARTYQVLGEGRLGTASTILVARQTRTRFTGEGAQEQHWTKVSGEGSGSARLHLETATGALLDATGEDTTAVTITASGRQQHFSQLVRERLSRLR